MCEYKQWKVSIKFSGNIVQMCVSHIYSSYYYYFILSEDIDASNYAFLMCGLYKTGTVLIVVVLIEHVSTVCTCMSNVDVNQ